MKILILGHAQHGKDTVREIIARQFPDIKADMFTSILAADLVMLPWFDKHFPNLYGSKQVARGIRVQRCYDNRDSWRGAWHNVIKQYNHVDGARLVKNVLDVADVYVGLRDPRELAAALPLFNVVLWVDATGRVPLESESSMGVKYQNSFVWIDNAHEDRGRLVADVERAIRHTPL